MGPLHSIAAMAQTSDSISAGDLDLLKLLCCVAWSDGEVSPEERRLLEVLGRRYFMTDASLPDAADAVAEMVSGAMGIEVIDTLAPRFTTHDEKQLALKLAYMVIRVGRNQGDTSFINEREKVAYRRLVDGLGLAQGEVEEAEWAAEQELKQHTNLFAVLASRFSSLGAWPSDTLLDMPGGMHL
jgi:uncharacterized tellurite resistance protein B-like protein